MIAYVFPGQGAQYTGMGEDLYQSSAEARGLFDLADQIMGFSLSKVMFEGTEEELVQTKVTQPAIFVQSVIKALINPQTFNPQAVAGHSLGEFSALTASGALTFEEGLSLVKERALAMQTACDEQPGTMAAILGLPDDIIESVCRGIEDIVVPANYNSPGQLVISGSVEGINKAVEALNAAGAKRAIVLSVGGAFHSPLMESARMRLGAAIDAAIIKKPMCPVYQNVNAKAVIDPNEIRMNLVAQLTSPVLWTQSVQQMVQDGFNEFIEVGGKGNILRGMIRKIEPTSTLSAL
jgi:[acyl-carrier-protein] S-malonyltransferase